MSTPEAKLNIEETPGKDAVPEISTHESVEFCKAKLG